MGARSFERPVPLMVVYGDNFVPFDVLDALKYHYRHNADMTVVTIHVTDPDYGLVINSESVPVGDKVFAYNRRHTAKPPYLTNIGTYFIGERVISYMRALKWEGIPLSLEHRVMTNEFFGMFRVLSHCVDGLPYYDVGTPERYKASGGHKA